MSSGLNFYVFNYSNFSFRVFEILPDKIKKLYQEKIKEEELKQKAGDTGENVLGKQ